MPISSPSPPDSLEPGTIVEKEAPKGWSRLVIKSLPRIRDDYKKGVPELTVEKASWMFTAFLANVVKDENGRYKFDKAGLGLGAKAKEKDTILTAETGRKLGGDLGLFGGEILNKGYEVQKKAVMVFSGPSMGLLRHARVVPCRRRQQTGAVPVRHARRPSERPPGNDRVADPGTDGVGTSFDGVWLRSTTPYLLADLVVDKKKINRFGIPSGRRLRGGEDAGGPPGAPDPRGPPETRGPDLRFTADGAYCPGPRPPPGIARRKEVIKHA